MLNMEIYLDSKYIGMITYDSYEVTSNGHLEIYFNGDLIAIYNHFTIATNNYGVAELYL